MFTRRPGILVQGFLFTSEVKKIQCYDFSKHRAIGVDIITGVMEGDVIRDYYDSASDHPQYSPQEEGMRTNYR